MEGSGFSPEERKALVWTLLTEVRVAALSTLADGNPSGSMASFVANRENGEIYLHLSRMARHTKNLTADPRISLLVIEADGPDKNPQALPRVIFNGRASVLEPGSETHAKARASYLDRYPESEMTFQLPDFNMFVLRPESIQLVAGFGKAFTMQPAAFAPG
ncbi:MAG: HugZ family protein [Leptospirillia bacterium]